MSEQRFEPQSERILASSPLLQREAREAAHRWLARFAPLLEDPAALVASEVRERLEQVPALRAEGERALADLHTQAGPEEANLAATLGASLKELDAAETDLRRRLGVLAPGDPLGAVDLAAFRERLAEAQARREVESLTGTTPMALTPRLELKTAPPNLAAAAGMGVFSLGWLSFTTFHAFMMIGGFSRAFGPFAFFLLLFYSIFFFVGFGMAAAAYRSACREEIELSGRELTVRRTGLWRSEKQFALSPDSRAYLTDPTHSQWQNRNSWSTPQPGTTGRAEVALVDERGREVRLAAGRPFGEQERLIERINAYLDAQK